MSRFFLRMIDGPVIFEGGNLISISEQKLHFLSIVATHALSPVSRETVSSVMWASGSQKVLNHRIAQLVHSTNKAVNASLIQPLGSRYLTTNPQLLTTDIIEETPEDEQGDSVDFWLELEIRLLYHMETRTTPDFIIWRRKTINQLRYFHKSNRIVYTLRHNTEKFNLRHFENNVSEARNFKRNYISDREGLVPAKSNIQTGRTPEIVGRGNVIGKILEICDKSNLPNAHLIRLNGLYGVGKSRILSAVESSLREFGNAVASSSSPPRRGDPNESSILNLFGGEAWSEISRFLSLECQEEGEKIQLPQLLSGERTGDPIGSGKERDPMLRVAAQYLSHKYRYDKLFIFLDSDPEDADIFDYSANYFLNQIKNAGLFVFRSASLSDKSGITTIVPRTVDPNGFIQHDIAIEPLTPSHAIELAQTILPRSESKVLASGAAYLGGGIPRRVLWIARQLLGATDLDPHIEAGASRAGTDYILNRLTKLQLAFLTKIAVSLNGVDIAEMTSENISPSDKSDIVDLEIFGWIGARNGRLVFMDPGLREAVKAQISPLALANARRELLSRVPHNGEQENIVEKAFYLLEDGRYDEAVDIFAEIFLHDSFHPWQYSFIIDIFDRLLASPVDAQTKYRIIVSYADGWTRGEYPMPPRTVCDRCWSTIRLWGETPDSLRARSMVRCARLASPEKGFPDPPAPPSELNEAITRQDYQCFGMVALSYMRTLEHHLVKPELQSLIDLVRRTVCEIEEGGSDEDIHLLHSISAADIQFGNLSRGQQTISRLLRYNTETKNKIAKQAEHVWHFIYLYHKGELNTDHGIAFRRSYSRYACSDNDPVVKVNYAINSSIWFLDIGDIEAARLALNEAESLLSVMVPKAVRRRFLYNKGEIDLRAGDADSALSHFQRAVEVFGPEHNDPGSLLISAGTAVANRISGRTRRDLDALPPLDALSGRWAIDLTLVLDAYRRTANSNAERNEWVKCVSRLVAEDCIPSRIWRAKLHLMALRASQEWGKGIGLPGRLLLADELEERGVSSLAVQLRAD
jgi:tetratricopeptide (TPR) repeat protein